jgi:hypothetical protein
MCIRGIDFAIGFWNCSDSVCNIFCFSFYLQSYIYKLFTRHQFLFLISEIILQCSQIFRYINYQYITVKRTNNNKFFDTPLLYLISKQFILANIETLSTLGTQDTRRRQSRDTVNIRYTRHTTKTIQRHCQH